MGHLFIPSFRVQGAVLFLLDTGSRETMLHAEDVLDLAMPVDRLRAECSLVEMTGIGGHSVPYFRVQARLAFVDEEEGPPYVQATKYYNIPLLICDPTHGGGLPSLLGMDVLQHWVVDFDANNGTVHCKPRYADLTL